MITPPLMGGAVRQPTQWTGRFEVTRLLRRIVWLVGFIVLSGSCLRSPLFPEGDAGLVGPIVAIGQGLWEGRRIGPFQIHVKSDWQDACGIIFTVDPLSRIVDSRDAKSVTASADILAEGAIVAVWFRDVLDSCPGQSRAQTVERRE